jgi:hypothetical protein
MPGGKSLFVATLRAFAAQGFEPVSLAAIVDPRSQRDARSRSGDLRRMFRYEKEGVSSIVEARGAVRSPWRREVIRGLKRSGYALWFRSSDEAVYRRWLLKGGEIRSELALLEKLGEHADVRQWPRRSESSEPKNPTVRPVEQWVETIGAVFSTRIAWTEVSLSLNQSLFVTRADGPAIRLYASALASYERERGPTMDIALGLSDEEGRDHVPSTEVSKRVRKELRASGFKLVADKDRKGRFSAVTSSPSWRSIARDCARAFATLQSACHTRYR